MKCSFSAECAHTGHELTGFLLLKDRFLRRYRVESVPFFHAGVTSLILLWHSDVNRPPRTLSFWVPWNLLYKDQCITGSYVMCVIALKERSVGCKSLCPSYNPFCVAELHLLHLIKGLRTITSDSVVYVCVWSHSHICPKHDEHLTSWLKPEYKEL